MNEMNMNRLKALLKQVDWEKRSVLEKIGLVYLSGLFALFVYGTIVRPFMPMSCNEARQTLAKQQKDHDKTFSQLDRLPHPEIAVIDANRELRDAESKASDRCP